MECKKRPPQSLPLDPEEVNLDDPFIVLRKYQGRMMSATTKTKWKEIGHKKGISEYIDYTIGKLYER